MKEGSLLAWESVLARTHNGADWEACSCHRRWERHRPRSLPGWSMRRMIWIRVTTRMGQVLARENARVVVTDLNLDSCQETQASLRFPLKAYKVLSTRMVDFLKIVTYVSLLE